MNKQGPNGIDWCDWTWSPMTGCLGPNGVPCSYCYARRIAERFRPKVAPFNVAPGTLLIAGKGYSFPIGFHPTFYPHRLAELTPKQRPWEPNQGGSNEQTK